MTFTHYKVLPNGKTEMFNTTTCEICERVAKDVNSVGGITSDIPTYHKLGMKEWTGPWPLPELFYIEELDAVGCEDCQL